MNVGFQIFISLLVAAPVGVVLRPALVQEGDLWAEATEIEGANPVAADAEVMEPNNYETDSIQTETAEAAPTEARPTEAQPADADLLAFSCQMNQGIPSTVVETPLATVPIVHWDSRAIALETTPASDCEASIERFQTAYDDGLLSYITTGRMDGQLVMCTADTVNGRCVSRLLNLRTTPKPRLALQRVLQISLPTEGPISDTGCRAYVELDRYLQGDYNGDTDVCPPETIPALTEPRIPPSP